MRESGYLNINNKNGGLFNNNNDGIHEIRLFMKFCFISSYSANSLCIVSRLGWEIQFFLTPNELRIIAQFLGHPGINEKQTKHEHVYSFN